MANQDQNIKQPRPHRNFRIHDSVYYKAMERAAKDRYKLSNIIEDVVRVYADGGNVIKFLKDNDKKSKK